MYNMHMLLVTPHLHRTLQLSHIRGIGWYSRVLTYVGVVHIAHLISRSEVHAESRRLSNQVLHAANQLTNRTL